MAPTVLLRVLLKALAKQQLSYLLAKGMISYCWLVSLSASAVAQEVQTLGRAALSVPTDVGTLTGEHTCP